MDDAQELEHNHDDPKSCWCKPDMIFEYEDRQVWVHKGPGEELAPGDVIAEAVYNVLMDR